MEQHTAKQTKRPEVGDGLVPLPAPFDLIEETVRMLEGHPSPHRVPKGVGQIFQEPVRYEPVLEEKKDL